WLAAVWPVVKFTSDVAGMLELRFGSPVARARYPGMLAWVAVRSKMTSATPEDGMPARPRTCVVGHNGKNFPGLMIEQVPPCTPHRVSSSRVGVTVTTAPALLGVPLSR